MIQKIEDIENQIIDEFSLFDEWLDKYNLIIERAITLPPIDEAHRREEYLIQGCQSRVWIDAKLSQGVIYFSGDSDAIITKGIVALLISVLNGHTPREILDAKLEFINKIGLSDHLSPTRANGLVEMIKRMKFFAKSYDSTTDTRN